MVTSLRVSTNLTSITRTGSGYYLNTLNPQAKEVAVNRALLYALQYIKATLFVYGKIIPQPYLIVNTHYPIETHYFVSALNYMTTYRKKDPLRREGLEWLGC